MTKAEPKQIMPYRGALTKEAIDGLKEQITLFNEFIDAALDKNDDIIKIEGKDYLLKSAWRKLAFCTRISVKLIGKGEKIYGRDKSGEYYIWTFKAKAVDRDGREVISSGSCSSRDPFFARKDGKLRPSDEINESDIYNTAVSNAISRAISDLIGFGKVPGEEMRGKMKTKELELTKPKLSNAEQAQINEKCLKVRISNKHFKYLLQIYFPYTKGEPSKIDPKDLNEVLKRLDDYKTACELKKQVEEKIKKYGREFFKNIDLTPLEMQIPNKEDLFKLVSKMIDVIKQKESKEKDEQKEEQKDIPI